VGVAARPAAAVASSCCPRVASPRSHSCWLASLR
jgi:hypothetical protein